MNSLEPKRRVSSYILSHLEHDAIQIHPSLLALRHALPPALAIDANVRMPFREDGVATIGNGRRRPFRFEMDGVDLSTIPMND